MKQRVNHKVITGPMDELCYPIAENVSAVISCLGSTKENTRDGKPFLGLSTEDFAPITTYQYDDSIEFIKKHIKDGDVQVICEEGHSRSVSIALAYLMSTGMSYEKAINDFGHGLPSCLVHQWSLIQYAHKKGYIDDKKYKKKMAIINKARG
jgi:protein-tyrosine phosphatase